MSGINSSSTVAKFTALQAGQAFAGCESLHGAGTGTYTIDSSNMIIRIMVWKNTISDVGIKLVRVDNWSLGEIKIPNTAVGKWEQLEFDFSAHLGLTYDQVVIFPDFTNRSSDNIIYFDNVFGDTSSSIISSNLALENSNSELFVFPNPNPGQLNIECKALVSGKLILSDLLGKTILEKTIDTDFMQIDFPSTSSKGLYLLSIINAKGELVETKKINYTP
jgi:hypothetical protein